MPPRAVSMPQPWPAVSPDHMKLTERLSPGACESADRRLADDAGRRQILEAQAIEDVLPGRQILEQRLGGKVALGQRVDEARVTNVFEAVGGRHLDQHAGWAIGPRPHHAGIDRHVAGLDTVRNNWALGRALKAGAAKALVAAAEPRVVRNRRRVVALPERKRPDMKEPPTNHRGGWGAFLTAGKRYDDESVTRELTLPPGGSKDRFARLWAVRLQHHHAGDGLGGDQPDQLAAAIGDADGGRLIFGQQLEGFVQATAMADGRKLAFMASATRASGPSVLMARINSSRPSTPEGLPSASTTGNSPDRFAAVLAQLHRGAPAAAAWRTVSSSRSSPVTPCDAARSATMCASDEAAR